MKDLDEVIVSRDEVLGEILHAPVAPEAPSVWDAVQRVASLASLAPVRDEDGELVDLAWTWLTPAAEELLGTPGQLGARLLRDGDPRWRTQLWPGLARVLAGEVTWEGEVGLRRLGVERWLRVVASRAGDEILTSWSDVTDRRRAEGGLRDGDRLQDEFLATLGHELRNVLAPIRMATDLLNRQPGSAPLQQRAREVLDRQTRHLARLVEGLIDVSRLRRGGIERRSDPVDAKHLLDAAVTLARPVVDAAGHALTVTPVEHEVALRGDEGRLALALAQLLDNAARFTPRGGHLDLGAQVHDEALVIRVRDDGIGLAADDLQTVFLPFFRGESGRILYPAGLGCGLSMVRLVVEQHGGTVWAESAGRGAGSAFEVVLPLEHATAPRRAARPLRVLIADHDRDCADGIADWLELAGHEVRRAYSGRHAVEAARSSRPHVALLDLGLPDVDGLEVARRLRGDPATQGTVLIAVTRWTLDDHRRQACAAGFDHHLVKPLDPRILPPLFSSMCAAG